MGPRNAVAIAFFLSALSVFEELGCRRPLHAQIKMALVLLMGRPRHETGGGDET